MVNFNPQKLKIIYLDSKDIDILSRKYTLTHSDLTGELFLSIGREYDMEKLKGWYTRLMRDEVLAEWKKESSNYNFHIYLHVSGGVVLGGTKFRDRILRSHLPLVLEIFRYAERDVIKMNEDLQKAKILVHFKSKRKKYNRIENMGEMI